MGLKWTEILLILFALMLLFGTTRLPQLGQSLGSAIRNFKKGFTEPDAPIDEKPAVTVEKKIAEGGDQSVTTAEKTATKQS